MEHAFLGREREMPHQRHQRSGSGSAHRSGSLALATNHQPRATRHSRHGLCVGKPEFGWGVCVCVGVREHMEKSVNKSRLRSRKRSPTELMTQRHVCKQAICTARYPICVWPQWDQLYAAPTYPTLATNALLRFHQHQKQQHQHQHQQHQQHHQQHQPHHQHHPKHLHQQQKPPPHNPTTAAALLAPLHSLTSLQLTQQQRFLGKTPQQLLDIAPTSPAAATNQNGAHGHGHGAGGNGQGNASAGSNGKRKRSWSRAVFTNLQRKGLEIQFQQQKYITKPDRRKLAARLNLTDAQVKVWFQNRRMKWRHTRENLKSGQEKQPSAVPGSGVVFKASTASGGSTPQEPLDYSSDSCSSVDLSEQADDDDNIEINVVE
ncbi:homeobox protein H2.0 isoform X1 [Drosophila teissieri]|uniref:homeobox protein H2.0 isoform X1 n=1 Tax=Drosophila teissieri TaxID=7243 RepID=UPI001CB9E3B4|nr:homeobox protein H2.0 isoform X1 [Drosophila teissieri]